MTGGKTGIAEATKIDFTGKISEYQHFKEFSPDVISLVRSASPNKLLVVVDQGYAMKSSAPHLVQDHLNLTGTNPLVGPNDSCGERFPSVNDIYVLDDSMPSGIAAGLKPGIKPTTEEETLIQKLGAEFYCYNLVPTMIVAAHAGWKVIGVVVPEGTDGQVVTEMIEKIGDK